MPLPVAITSLIVTLPAPPNWRLSLLPVIAFPLATSRVNVPESELIRVVELIVMSPAQLLFPLMFRNAPVAADARAVQGQRFVPHRDAALKLQRRAAGDGRAGGGCAKAGRILDVQHSRAHRRRARVGVRAGEREPCRRRSSSGRPCR